MIADDMAVHLSAYGLGTVDHDIMRGFAADEPDSAIVIYPYPGGPGERVQGIAGYAYDHPSFQVVVRDFDLQAAYQRAALAVRALSRVVNTQFANGDYYLQVDPLTEPFELDHDDKRRFRVAFNCRAHRRRGES